MLSHRHRNCGILCLCEMNVFYKSELTELKEKDACCPKDKKMEVEENKK